MAGIEDKVCVVTGANLGDRAEALDEIQPPGPGCG
jgi:hypothetical protein